MIAWTALPRHRNWLAAEGSALLRFANASRRDAGGFTWLQADGTPRNGPVETWITARMTHCFSLAALQGIPGAAPYADHGVRALATLLRDDEHGGWFAGIDTDGSPLDDGRKSGYPHAFVVLSSSSATAAGRPGAAELLTEALRIVEQRFWDDDEGRCRESWDRQWTLDESYRGANSNMHMVEAFLAASDVTKQPVWRERALSVCDHVVREARDHGWRLVEHFDRSWAPDLEYNRDRPNDPFRPYGSTIGHWLEWARLLLQLEAALPDPPRWLLEGAVAFFDLAVAEGWQVDGRPGFVYTVDWEGKPVVRTRMHWVLAEAILTAAALRARTGEARYEECYRTWWDHADEFYLDRRYGSWHHELDPENRPSATVWDGKPDIYHAYQATLFPLLPLSPAASVVLSRGDFTDARQQSQPG